MTRKILCSFICLFVLVSFFCVKVSAAQNPAHGTITVETVNAAVGDTVIVPVRIENNPGIMAITVSVTYDTEALTYEKYIKGYLKDYTVADHPGKSLIRFVNCEQKDRNNNDIMVSFQFKVKDTASFDLHPISIEYKAGDFCNWNLEKLTPVIVPGGVNVAFNGSNCRHQKYGDWETVANPGCTTPGAKQRNCLKCGHTDIAEIEPVGHTYEETWTIDKPATKTELGQMSRHCVRCDSYTDLLTFTLKQTEEEKISNKENTELSKNKFISKLIKEQLPEEETKKQESSQTDKDKETKPDSHEESAESAEKTPDGTQTVGSAPGADTEVAAVDALLATIPDISRFATGLLIALYIFLRLSIL